MDNVFRELYGEFGSEVTLRAVREEFTDYSTGDIIRDEKVRAIRAIVLPNYLKYSRVGREGVSGGLMVNERSVLTQAEVTYDDYLLFDDKTWEVTEINRYLGTIELVCKEIERGS